MLGGAALAASSAEKGPREVWSAIGLNFGTNPVSEQLNITFARVSYISQPPQWNTTGFSTAKITNPGGWMNNTTAYGTSYGIMKFNSSSGGATGITLYNLTSYRTTNVSYLWTDQRAAINGTGTTWQYGISANKTAAAFPTTGHHLNAGSSSGDQSVWVQANYQSGSKSFNFTAYDWEYKGNPGHFTNVTPYNVVVSGTTQLVVPGLTFFELYVYVTTTQTVVSVVNTTNGVVLGQTAAMHPTFDAATNESKIAYAADVLVAGSSSTNTAMIVDNTMFVDHNTYASQPPALPRAAPATVGALSAGGDAPFDPASLAAGMTSGVTSDLTVADLDASLGDFTAHDGGLSIPSQTSSLIKTGAAVTPTSNLTTVYPQNALNTVRSENEDQTVDVPSMLYTGSWSPATLQAQVQTYLLNYVSAHTGIPVAVLTLPSALVSNVAVWTTFSTQAAGTIHDYLSSALPGELASNNLALVSNSTGAVLAGAYIGEFMDPITGALFAPVTNDNGAVFDPVTHHWYASAIAAGFPTGSIAFSGGAIRVPGQAPFLGFSASGMPEFGPGGCFVLCTGLNGAASAVSSYFGQAGSAVTNLGSGLTPQLPQVASSVIKAVAGSLGTDVAGLTASFATTVANVIPILGATAGNVGGAVTGLATKNLGAVGASIGSVASGAAGAILSGVDSVSNTIAHIGAAAGSAVSNVTGQLAGGLNAVATTAGTIVNDAQAVLSPAFTTAANLAGNIGTTTVVATQSLLASAPLVAGSLANALDTVGTVVTKSAGTIYTVVATAFGTAAGALVHVVDFFKQTAAAVGSLFSWPAALSTSVGLILEIVIIVVVVGVTLFLLVWWLMKRHRKHGKSHERGGENSRRGGRERGHKA